MSEAEQDARAVFAAALGHENVQRAARTLKGIRGEPSLPDMLALSQALSEACGADEASRQLAAELSGYQDSGLEVPPERRATGFASPFPVRALDLGIMDPEEIFLANREKFSQVTLTIVQPISELEQALGQIRAGGVLALKVPASEVTGESAQTSADTEVYIYILPREIQRIVDSARARALNVLIGRIVEAAVNES